MKRFYTLVSTKQVSGGYEVLLDGRPVKAPSKRTLLAPNESLAGEIVKEWAAQEEQILPNTMPLTQILTTKIDKVSNEREAMSLNVLKYLNTDLLCYRASEPLGMPEAQAGKWDPVLEWFAERFGSELQTTTGLTALTQPESAHKAVQAYVGSLDDDRFTLLQLITPLSGSLILALAFLEGKLSPQEVFDACHVEEQFRARIYDEEKYGPDPLQEKKDKAMMIDLEASKIYLESMH